MQQELVMLLFLSELKGKKHLIVGNHDKYWMKKTDMDCLTGHYVFDAENNPIKQAAMIVIKDGEGVFDRMF